MGGGGGHSENLNPLRGRFNEKGWEPLNYTIILQAIATSNRIKTSTGLYITVIVAHDVINSYVKLVSSYSYGKCALCGETSTNGYKALKLYLMNNYSPLNNKLSS